jgi:hypothetical protein
MTALAGSPLIPSGPLGFGESTAGASAYRGSPADQPLISGPARVMLTRRMTRRSRSIADR